MNLACTATLRNSLRPSDDERLQFAKGELPPPLIRKRKPRATDQWDELRLAKANRNYALDYIRNGIAELAHVMGGANSRVGQPCCAPD